MIRGARGVIKSGSSDSLLRSHFGFIYIDGNNIGFF